MARKVWEALHARAAMKWWHVLAILLGLLAANYAVQKEAESSLEDYSDKNRQELEQAALEGCRRGNLQRAYELANDADGPERAELARDLQPIVWCYESVRSGETVLVPTGVEESYVNAVVDVRCWPQLSEDPPVRIIGCDDLPSDSQR